MSAATLREAARLMRERAEAVNTRPSTLSDGESYSWAEGIHFLLQDPDAEHIASWHPTVAVAVADWLDGVATEVDRRPIKHTHRALAVARAYLGETS